MVEREVEPLLRTSYFRVLIGDRELGFAEVSRLTSKSDCQEPAENLEILHPADHVEPDVVGEECLQLGAEVPLQQHHQRADFSRRPLPVLHGERVKREDPDAETGGGFNRVADGVDAGPVTLDARQVALCSPPPVAIHDDGDVRRQAIEIDLADERLVRMAGRNPRQEFLTGHLVDRRTYRPEPLIIVHPDQETTRAVPAPRCAPRPRAFRPRTRSAMACAGRRPRPISRVCRRLRAPCGEGSRRR